MKTTTFMAIILGFCCGNALASDEALSQAIKVLDGRVKTTADKQTALYAVSRQTGVPEATLQADMNATHLGYGELLAAESLAKATGKNLSAVLSMKQGKGWAELSKEMKIDPGSIVGRLENAAKTMQGKQNMRMAKGSQNMQQGVRPAQPPAQPSRMGTGY